MKKPRTVNTPEVKIAYDAHTDTLTLGSHGRSWESLGEERAGLTVYIRRGGWIRYRSDSPARCTAASHAPVHA